MQVHKNQTHQQNMKIRDQINCVKKNQINYY
jgi:hypothetical protein